jgi:hypothetical protein
MNAVKFYGTQNEDLFLTKGLYYIIEPLPMLMVTTTTTVKKASGFTVPSRDVTNQTLPGRE